ncbi:MAG: hypothetical protein QW463_02490 [Candidatus Caldarchaeum sp.]
MDEGDVVDDFSLTFPVSTLTVNILPPDVPELFDRRTLWKTASCLFQRLL